MDNKNRLGDIKQTELFKHSRFYKRDKLIKLVKTGKITNHRGLVCDPEELVNEYERAMDVKIINGDADAKLFSVGKTVDDVWHLHLEDMVDYREFCNAATVRHNPEGAGDEPEKVLARAQRFARFSEAYEKLYGHPPSEYYYGPGRRQEVPMSGVPGPVPRPDGSFTIFVKSLTGNTMTIDAVKTTTKISALYNRISRKTGIPVEQLILLFDRKRLSRDNNETVGDYGILDNSTLCYILNARGC